MVKFSYHPEPGVSDETEQFGVQFADGKPSEVTDEKAIETLRGNRFFKAHDGEKKADTTKPAATKSAAKPADTTKPADIEFTAPLVAKDKGGGWWAVYDADGKEVGKSMRAADAEAFNASTDDEKAVLIND